MRAIKQGCTGRERSMNPEENSILAGSTLAATSRTTRHLLLRAFEPGDVDRVHAIQRDSDAMQYTWVAPDLAATAAYLQSHAARRAGHGFAPWIAVLRSEQRIVGYGGLYKDPAAPQWGTEVIYFLERSCWGRGLASEIVEASLELAFTELGLREVGAFARPQNTRSVRVLAKAGFERVEFLEEFERDRFRIDAAKWRSRRLAVSTGASR